MSFSNLAFDLLVAGLALAPLVLVFLWLRRRKKDWPDWPTIFATVEEVCADEWEVPGSVESRYAGGIIYSYQVDGKTYKGLYDSPDSYNSVEDARERLKHWIGRKVRIEYDLANPERSFFRDE